MTLLESIVRQVLAYVVTILGIVTGIQGLQQQQATKQQASDIYANTVALLADHHTISDQIDALAGQLAQAQTDITTAVNAVRIDLASPHAPTIDDVLDALDAGVTVVALPQTPPPGYGGATADEVWAARYQDTYATFADLLARAGTESWWRSYLTPQPLLNAPWFTYENAPDMQAGLGNPELTYLGPPEPDYQHMADYTSVLEWLNETDQWHGGDWHEDTATRTCYVDIYHPLGHFYVTVRCILTPADWALLTGTLSPANRGAPVWPGLDNVTLGTPVAITSNTEIPGPLDGLLIAITTPPAGSGAFEVGGLTWFWRAGQVSFVSDNGDAEPWQYLTWDAAVYVPRNMRHAASAILRGLGGMEGTATPWLATS